MLSKSFKIVRGNIIFNAKIWSDHSGICATTTLALFSVGGRATIRESFRNVGNKKHVFLRTFFFLFFMTMVV